MAASPEPVVHQRTVSGRHCFNYKGQWGAAEALIRRKWCKSSSLSPSSSKMKADASQRFKNLSAGLDFVLSLFSTYPDHDSGLSRLPLIAVSDFASPALVMNAGVPQRCVHGSLLYSHFTHGRVAKCDSGCVIKSAGGKNWWREAGILMRPASPPASQRG